MPSKCFPASLTPERYAAALYGNILQRTAPRKCRRVSHLAQRLRNRVPRGEPRAGADRVGRIPEPVWAMIVAGR